jgi:hypothetical protein
MAAPGGGDLNMRYRLMATYRGVPYEAGVGPADDDVVLFAACPPPEELGFEPATGHWRKELRIEDVQALWESRPMGKFRGDRCIVLDDLGDRLHIAYLGHDGYQAEQLGYWEVDRGVFELITPREEVSEIVEERLDYPRRSSETSRNSTGQHAIVPRPSPPYTTAPQAAAPAAPVTVPQAAVPYGTGPQPAVPYGTGPLPAVPYGTLPQPAVSGSTGPQAAVSNPTGPQPSMSYQNGPREPGSGHAGPGAVRDLAVIPSASEPPLPLEAAARRAASARVLQPAGRPATAPAPQPATVPAPQPAPPQPAPPPAQSAPPAPQTAPPATQTAPAVVQTAPPTLQTAPPTPQTAPPAALRPEPAPRGPEPAPSEPPAPSRQPASRRRRSALRRQATQRIFSELASLAAIPPSAYALGEEVDGAMCLIQTPDGFEVFNAAAGARHEVRIFDDEESAYFYLFGVLAAEAVRTGRLAPQG